MSKLYIRDVDLVVTMDDDRHELRSQDILIEDKTIKAIGPNLEIPPDAQIIEGSGKIALPGFINTHHHLWQVFCRDLPRTLNAPNLFDWLVVKYGIWQEVDPELVYMGALVALGLLLKTGCTLSSDDFVAFTGSLDRNLIDQTIKAAQELGIRFQPTHAAISQAGPFVPDNQVHSDEEILLDYERLVNKYHDPSPFSMTRISLGPPFLPLGTKHHFVETIRYARKHGLHCHTHLAEGGEDEDAWSMEHYGVRPFEAFESFEWVGSDVWFAHCITLHEEDIKRMGEYHCGLAHCPVSNARINRRVAPIFEMMEQGVRVSFGVDGAAGYGDVISEMQNAMVLHKYVAGGTHLERKMLEIATRGGAEVLGWDSLGSLEPGKAADVALVDAQQLDYAGATHDLPASLLHFGVNHIVDTTICNGEVVVEEGQLTRVDEEKIIKRANELSKEYIERASKRTGIDYSKIPTIE